MLRFTGTRPPARCCPSGTGRCLPGPYGLSYRDVGYGVGDRVAGEACTLEVGLDLARLVPGALHRLALRPSELEHVVRLQNGDNVSDVARARLEPDGQLLVTLRAAEQSATKGDVEELRERLAAIERLLAGMAAGGRPPR
ncbi:YetF domain-containing protein [Kitasatospora sp. NPDC101155]|uniref:YetF domain-containing protein n=1 Tax=Kitasatospora sp. NPDC101155 TaxID=3364097 RepID=UPI0038136833